MYLYHIANAHKMVWNFQKLPISDDLKFWFGFQNLPIRLVLKLVFIMLIK